MSHSILGDGLTEMSRELAETIVQLLEAVITHEMTPDAALSAWPEMNGEVDRELAAAWHDLSLYATDADIREKDREYEHYQLSVLRKHAQGIRRSYLPKRSEPQP